MENDDLFEKGHIWRTNGASKNMGFSFLLDPVLNDEFKWVNSWQEKGSLTNNFYQGFKVIFINKCSKRVYF